MDYKLVTECRICKSANLRKYLNLGHVPLCNKLLSFDSIKPITYPIEVLFCEDCSLSQLSIVVRPEILYTKYLYHSSISKTFQKHCNDMAISIKSNFKFKNNPPTCMDIAANDGCLLKEFKKNGYVVRGYEPCDELAVKSWEDELILVTPDFFNEKVSNRGRSWSGEDVITATNVLAHIDDLYDFIRGVKYQLEYNPQGIFVVEVPYLVNLINKNQFDTIYHEHLSYFLLKPLIKLFKENGLPIFKVEKYPIHGGSIRIYSSQDYYPEESSVKEMLDNEDTQGFYNFSKYETFSDKVNTVRDDLIRILVDLNRDDKKVMGYGASAKGISLLNYCAIPNNMISCIVDDTPDKQDKITPGSNIPIVDFNSFEDVKPDYILLLAWNFADELIEKTKHIGAKYIIPIPDVRII